MVPESGFNNPDIKKSSEVFPQPEGPIIAQLSGGSILSEISSSTGWIPVSCLKLRQTELTLIIGYFSLVIKSVDTMVWYSILSTI